MSIIIDLLEGLFGIAIGVFGILYYRGSLSLPEKGEMKRQEIVKKHGWLLKLCIVGSIFCGLLILTILFASLIVDT